MPHPSSVISPSVQVAKVVTAAKQPDVAGERCFSCDQCAGAGLIPGAYITRRCQSGLDLIYGVERRIRAYRCSIVTCTFEMPAIAAIAAFTRDEPPHHR